MCEVKPLKSISLCVPMCMKLENLLFANNREFPTTTPVGVGPMEHQQLNLALHLVHRMPVNEIIH
jgi:hypothetical protein